MPVKLVTVKDSEFYTLIGPFLANRSVAKEIGYHIYEDDKTQWVLSTDRNNLAAFAAVRVTGKLATVTACYTVERYRRRGFMKQVLAFAIKNIVGVKFKASANENSLPVFRSLGFKRVRDNGRFVVVELENA